MGIGPSVAMAYVVARLLVSYIISVIPGNLSCRVCSGQSGMFPGLNQETTRKSSDCPWHQIVSRDLTGTVRKPVTVYLIA